MAEGLVVASGSHAQQTMQKTGHQDPIHHFDPPAGKRRGDRLHRNALIVLITPVATLGSKSSIAIKRPNSNLASNYLVTPP